MKDHVVGSASRSRLLHQSFHIAFTPCCPLLLSNLLSASGIRRLIGIVNVMATRSKTSAPATRASTRTKTQAVPPTSTGPPVVRAPKERAASQTGLSKAKATASRKPFVNKANAPDDDSAAPIGGFRPAKATSVEREPTVAYLRVRPQLGDDEPMAMPYLESLSDTAVRMSDPSNDRQGSSKAGCRASVTAPSSIYKFSHVFPPSTLQEEFFATTTLPLVRDLLDGQNGLLFAYGVTNSGKTYTIQGGSKPGSAGILPRALDVLFNSIGGLHSDGRYRPVRLYGLEEADPSESAPPTKFDVPNEPALAQVLEEHLATSDKPNDNTDPTVIRVDRNYEYSIWISYVEVYNEKVYDLLASVDENEEGTGYHQEQGLHSLLLKRKALMVKPSPAMDTIDSGSTGRYISGLKQFRVTDAAQAKALIKLGQLHRRVFGTLANSQSSRSHSIVTIRVLKGHRAERDDPTSLQMSRLTVVDLAGSERAKNTQTSGDRLKEAGNINKSLMVLGQCMEAMRTNQKRLTQGSTILGHDVHEAKKALVVVPFRHSKLTEILMDYFVGDGKVVMIVNVNPYDSGFEEISHVMKFSALAREVSTVVNNAPLPRLQSSPTKPGLHAGLHPSRIPRGVVRKVTISSVGPGKKVSEAQLTILEEDEESDGKEDESDGEAINPLVDALFDEIENLRLKLYETEIRCAVVEAETREEVMKEMEERMREVERTYAQRLMSEVERNERKMDAKIDMLHQAGLLGTAKKPVISESETDGSDSLDENDIYDAVESFSDLPSSPLDGKANFGKSIGGKAKQFTLLSKSGETDREESKLSVGESGKDMPLSAASVKTVDVNHEADDSTIIVPNRKLGTDTGVVYIPGKGEADAAKKKKRQLGSKSVITQEQVEQVVGAMERKADKSTRIKRMARAS
ncbi:kinesin-domain-containing protein [Pisolithus marmoratus]|nr:kinesin-domain-containing protein [Pisolithus marmoratus]